MDSDGAELWRLTSFLTSNSAVVAKVKIRDTYANLPPGLIRIGDDCAAIPDGEGFLLFAAEGMLESFVREDPWFAGYSAIMVNLSDVAAMGGRSLAIVDVLWAPDNVWSEPIWQGMLAASRAYGVPIVGGHTTISGGAAFLAAAVLGRAERLITSFDAVPGDDLLMAVDLRGSYRMHKPFWNTSVGAPPERLQGDLRLLPELTHRALCRAGKDISNGGVVGTLSMLLECSGVGAEVALDLLPKPAHASLDLWTVTFPSFGYLLSVTPQNSSNVIALFADREINCAKVGKITKQNSLILTFGSAAQRFPNFS